MTPLAQQFLRQEMEGNRGLFTGADLISTSEIAQARCFDCTEVSQMAYGLADDMCRRDVIAKHVAFLPAPVTWVEHFLTGDWSVRAAFMLQALDDVPAAAVYQVIRADQAQADQLDMVLPAHLHGKVCVVLMGLLWLGNDAAPAGLCLPENLRAIEHAPADCPHGACAACRAATAVEARGLRRAAAEVD